MKITGHHASIIVGGRCAARLGGWRLEGSPAEGWAVEADVLEVNTIWLESGAALSLACDVGNKRWRWHGVTVERQGSRMTITGAGAPEVR